MKGQDLLSNLPEGCISNILSFTSPQDACIFSTLSSIFQSASESDIVWERFLPPDYPDILAGAVSPVDFSSKKELYFRLCDPIVIDEGKMSFSIDKMSGRKCYMLSARKLEIAWGDEAKYWHWAKIPESRFPEVAELLNVCWLEIRGKIDAHILSPKTSYKVYLVFKCVEDSYGLGHHFAETSVELGGQVSNNYAYLRDDPFNRFRKRVPVNWNDHQDPQPEDDGWMEVEMGDFFNDEGQEGEVEMSFLEIKGGRWKRGLILEGIEIRPEVSCDFDHKAAAHMERLKKMDLGRFFFCLVGVKSRDRELEMEGLDLFSNLPEGCISHIISFTSPRDACRSSAVCSIFRSASESDMVWERFLPSGYPDILAGSASPVQFSVGSPISLKQRNTISTYPREPCQMTNSYNVHPIYGFQEVTEFVQLLSIEIIAWIDAHIFSPKTTYN
ncbi:F-box protein PP2-B11 [Cinnamomum micranthum f. kanehirae]|uniref:F-box protein PP2-B11 n=1 Tax=Cinnamomum micranthum f. kanehirae TaxID=337451 RepID=A0A3S3R7Q4_9MAGN|nr:F-box protein PP2-B11 [Cinnamomum micranthum f. kanehirae]